VNSTLKIQKSEETLIEQIKAEIKKRSEAKAADAAQAAQKAGQTLRLVDQLVGVTSVFEERLQQPP
jgi:F0F1-type ATP synthase assembly protein I